MPSPAFDITSPLSDLVETTLKEGPQVVTKDGVETAILVSIEEWKRLRSGNTSNTTDPRKNLKDVLLDPNGPHDIYIPPRRRIKRRPPIKFE